MHPKSRILVLPVIASEQFVSFFRVTNPLSAAARNPFLTVPFLLLACLCGFAASTAARPAGRVCPNGVAAERVLPVTSPDYRRQRLLSAPHRINDGDTFEADLNGDGRMDFPRERVRLLYVDTPELSDSGRGTDRAHGLPAKEFLAQALQRGPIWLLIPRHGSRGFHGRTLALVMAGGCNVNLGLIRAGHAPFDTRFRFPHDYRRYAMAEGQAFDDRLGIWRRADSRQRYLERLRKNQKTPAGQTNPAFVPGVLQAERFRPRGLLGRYLRLEGKLVDRKKLSQKLSLLLLEAGRGERPFQAVLFHRTAQKLDTSGWMPGRRLSLEGFIATYRGRVQLQVHHGRLAR